MDERKEESTQKSEWEKENQHKEWVGGGKENQHKKWVGEGEPTQGVSGGGK